MLQSRLSFFTASKSFWRFLALSLLISLQGCGANPVERSKERQLEQTPKLRIQVCLPSKRIYFNNLELDRVQNHPLFTKYSPHQLDMAPKTIRRVAPPGDPRVANNPYVTHQYGINFGEVLNNSGGFSDGAGVIPLEDSTVADQPVFEAGYGFPVQKYVAIHVRPLDREKGREASPTYWFKLPKKISNAGFTAWFQWNWTRHLKINVPHSGGS
jgi:hypothetical protein